MNRNFYRLEHGLWVATDGRYLNESPSIKSQLFYVPIVIYNENLTALVVYTGQLEAPEKILLLNVAEGTANRLFL